MQETRKIWMNGELVDWGDAKIHVGAHGLHYGSGVFEGIRCYETDAGPAVFRLTPHLERLHNSARLIHMELPYSVEELRAASHELIGANGLSECYLRPIAFYGFGELGVHPGTNPVEVVLMSWPWGTYLGEDAITNGIRAKVSSWKRVGPNTIPHVSKATGIYLNSMLAVMEATRAGYDEAILLTDDGYVADGSGENIFVVKDEVVSTPDLSARFSPASRARPSSRSRRRSATRSTRSSSSAPISTSPTSSSCAGRPPRSRPSARWTTTRSARPAR
jgi:branched-chain amino acid aminotransferase